MFHAFFCIIIVFVIHGLFNCLSRSAAGESHNRKCDFIKRFIGFDTATCTNSFAHPFLLNKYGYLCNIIAVQRAFELVGMSLNLFEMRRVARFCVCVFRGFTSYLIRPEYFGVLHRRSIYYTGNQHTLQWNVFFSSFILSTFSCAAQLWNSAYFRTVAVPPVTIKCIHNMRLHPNVKDI